jgi:sugar (pentulose or hexulose) kinase
LAEINLRRCWRRHNTIVKCLNLLIGFTACLQLRTDSRSDHLLNAENDQRCLDEGNELLSSGISTGWVGMGPPRTGLAAKLLWAKRHQRESFDAAAYALGTKSFVGWWLTGEIATEPSSGPGSDRWAREIFEYIGFPVHKLPPIRGSLERLGVLKPTAALQLPWDCPCTWV